MQFNGSMNELDLNLGKVRVLVAIGLGLENAYLSRKGVYCSLDQMLFRKEKSIIQKFPPPQVLILLYKENTILLRTHIHSLCRHLVVSLT